MSESEPSSEKLARNWRLAQQRVETAQIQLSNAECELRNAENALGKRIDPGDMQNSEKICLWVRFDHHEEELLECWKQHDHYKVAVRKRR